MQKLPRSVSPLGILVAVLIAAALANIPASARERGFVEFAELALNLQTYADDELPSQIIGGAHVCWVGTQNRSKDELNKFLGYVEDEGFVDFAIQTVTTIADCGNDFIVIRSRPAGTVPHVALDDVDALSGGNAASDQILHEVANEVAFALVIHEPVPRFYVYLALPDDPKRVRALVQQELMQVITFASDITVNREAHSVIEERSPIGAPADYDPLWSASPSNICLYDVALLELLYGGRGSARPRTKLELLERLQGTRQHLRVAADRYDRAVGSGLVVEPC